MILDSFSRGYRIASSIAPVMLIPFILDLILMPGRLSGLSPDTVTYGAKFSTPIYLPSITDVYNFPPASLGEVQVGMSFPALSASNVLLVLLYAFVFTAVVAFLAGGYLGSIDAKRRELSGMSLIHRSFLDMCIDYFLELFGFALIGFLIVGLVAVALLGSPVLFLASFPFLIIIEYLLFLTPFAIVVDNMGLSAALSKSVRIATTKASTTIGYFVVYALIIAVISVPVYAIMNAQIVGYLLDSAGYAVVGTILVAATLAFYSESSQPSLTPSVLSRPITDETQNQELN